MCSTENSGNLDYDTMNRKGVPALTFHQAKLIHPHILEFKPSIQMICLFSKNYNDYALYQIVEKRVLFC